MRVLRVPKHTKHRLSPASGPKTRKHENTGASARPKHENTKHENTWYEENIYLVEVFWKTFGTIPPFLLCDNACCKTRRPRSPRRNTSSRVPRGLRGPRRLRRHDLLRGVPAWEIQEHGRLNALLRLQERAMDHSEHGIQRPRGVRVQGRLLQGSHARRKHVASLSSSLSSSLDDRRW